LPEKDSTTLAEAERLLRYLGLPSAPLSLAADGEDNYVVLAPGYVVRLRGGFAYDHRREVESARQAQALGVHAPSNVAAAAHWSVWERLPGTNQWRAPLVTPAFWRGLGQDLARLHALQAGPEATPPNLNDWHPLVPRIEGLAVSERRLLDRVAREEIPLRRLVYAHGDLHGGNMIVSPTGGYAGIVDWANAGWWPPEQDYAQLETEGLRQAMDWPFEAVDWSLVATLRIRAQVQAFIAGHIPLDDLREALGFWELMR
jgi:aminoglycoside phosphotransferase